MSLLALYNCATTQGC